MCRCVVSNGLGMLYLYWFKLCLALSFDSLSLNENRPFVYFVTLFLTKFNVNLLNGWTQIKLDLEMAELDLEWNSTSMTTC